MTLTAQQRRQFDEDGYLFFPDCFADEEIALMRIEGEKILRLDRQEVWREKTGAPRTAFAAHTFNEVFRLLAHHPRLVEPLEQVFGEPVYVHQFKLNAKAAFEGDVWQWHQDYGTWARDDGMPEPRAMNIAVFLDEVYPFNGALMLVPKSHKQGTLAAGHDKATTSYPLWTLDQETVTRLCREGEEDGRPGIVAPTGTPPAIVARLNALINDYLKSPLGQQQFEALDMQPVGGTPEALRAFIAGEVAKWGPIIKAAGITM